MSFDVHHAYRLLRTLANTHDDHDGGLRISAEDLGGASATLRDALTANQWIDGIPGDRATQLTGYFAQIRMAHFLDVPYGTVQQGALRFFAHADHGEALGPRRDVDAFVTLDHAIRSNLAQRFDRPGDPSLYYSAPALITPQTLHTSAEVYLSQTVYRELKGSYDCAHEQNYLLLANRASGVIERVLRPRYHEEAHHTSFERGWVDYVASYLHQTGSPYTIAGTYHSHPGVRTLTYATYWPSDHFDGGTDFFGKLSLIGHADTNDCTSPDFARTFQVHAYFMENDTTPTRVHARSLRVTPLRTDQPIVLDDRLATRGAFKRDMTLAVSRHDVQHMFGLAAHWLMDKDRRHLANIFEKTSTFPLHATQYYDGAYRLVLDLGQDTVIQIMHRPNLRWRTGAIGQFEIELVIDGHGIGHSIDFSTKHDIFQQIAALLKGSTRSPAPK